MLATLARFVLPAVAAALLSVGAVGCGPPAEQQGPYPEAVLGEGDLYGGGVAAVGPVNGREMPIYDPRGAGQVEHHWRLSQPYRTPQD